MKYVVVDKSSVSVDPLVHLTNGHSVILNEREVMLSRAVSGSFDERVKQMGGNIYEHAEIINLINKENWKYGNK